MTQESERTKMTYAEALKLGIKNNKLPNEISEQKKDPMTRELKNITLGPLKIKK